MFPTTSADSERLSRHGYHRAVRCGSSSQYRECETDEDSPTRHRARRRARLQRSSPASPPAHRPAMAPAPARAGSTAPPRHHRPPAHGNRDRDRHTTTAPTAELQPSSYSAPGASGFVGTWYGHDRVADDHRSGVGTAKESIGDGCCDPQLDLSYTLTSRSFPGRLAETESSRSECHCRDKAPLRLHGDLSTAPPTTGDVGILTLDNGVITLRVVHRHDLLRRSPGSEEHLRRLADVGARAAAHSGACFGVVGCPKRVRREVLPRAHAFWPL